MTLVSPQNTLQSCSRSQGTLQHARRDTEHLRAAAILMHSYAHVRLRCLLSDGVALCVVSEVCMACERTRACAHRHGCFFLHLPSPVPRTRIRMRECAKHLHECVTESVLKIGSSYLRVCAHDAITWYTEVKFHIPKTRNHDHRSRRCHLSCMWEPVPSGPVQIYCYGRARA